MKSKCLAIVLSDLKIFYYEWFVGWVLWHINPCRLFNAKSSFIYIYIYIYKVSKVSDHSRG